MAKLLSLKDKTNYKVYKEWCLTVFNYLQPLYPDFNDMVNGECGLKSIIAKADERQDLKLMKALYKETNIIVRETLTPFLVEPLNLLLKEKFSHDIADEIEQDDTTIQKIIKRGKIRNNKEFELVKRREEEIYSDDTLFEYAEQLRQLMSDYE